MSFSFSTIPADQERGKGKEKRKALPSRNQAFFTWSLLIIWFSLMIVGAISFINSEWLQAFSDTGQQAETRIYKNFGDSFRHQGKYREAINQYLKALEMQPEQVGVLINLAVTYIYIGELIKADEILKTAARLKSEHKELIYFNFAELFERQGKPDKAISFYKQAIGSAIDQDLVYRKLGALHLAAKQYEKALGAFESTLVYQTDVSNFYQNMLRRNIGVYENDTINLPIIEGQLGRNLSPEHLKLYDLEIIRQLQESDPEIAKTHNYLGYINYHLNRLDAAREHFRKSLCVWPGNSDAVKYISILEEM